MTHQVPLLIDGQFITSASTQTAPVLNPADQTVLAEVPYATDKEIAAAISGAKQCFADWRQTPVTERARLMFRYQQLLKTHQQEIAECLAQDNGKTLDDAKQG